MFKLRFGMTEMNLSTALKTCRGS